MLKVTAAVIEKDGLYFIARRKKSDRFGGKWEFPGGKIHIGETPEECLKRELKEEFGIESAIGELVCASKFSYIHMPLELLAFRVRHLSGEFKPVDHDAMKWVLPGELLSYDFVEADVTIVKKLLEDIDHAA